MANRVTTAPVQVLRRGANANARVTAAPIQILRSAGNSPPPAGKHYYWRVKITGAVGGASAVSFASIEALEHIYGLPAFRDGTNFTISASTTSTGNIQNTIVGNIGTANTWVGQISSNPIITLYFPYGANVDRLLFWQTTAGGSLPASGEVEWSDDGGTWTPAWTFSGGTAPSQAQYPSSFQNPSAADTPEETPLTLRFGRLHYVVDPARPAYSDAGITPITDGGRVHVLQNPTGHPDASTTFTQATLGNRPIWKSAGELGFPYLDMSGSEWFEDVPFTQPSGVSTWRPWMALAMVENPSRAGVSAFWGASPTNGGKAGFYLRPGNAGAEIQISNNSGRMGDYTSASRLLSAASRPPGSSVYLARVDEDDYRVSSSSNYLTNAIANANVLRNSGLGGVNGNPFNGRLYNLTIIDGANPVDFALAHIWMWGKYELGFTPSTEVEVDAVKGALRFRGKQPTVRVDEFVAAGMGSLRFTGKIPLVGTSVELNVPKGSLRFRGKLPRAAVGTVVIASDPGQLRFSGRTPQIYTDMGTLISQQASMSLGRVDPDGRASQLAGLSLGKVIPGMDVSQLASLTLGKVIPPMSVTQFAELVLVKPIIPPVMLPEPEDGISETLEWKTDVIVSNNGQEQRISLREYPRRTFAETIVIDDHDWLQDLLKVMALNFGRTFVLPLFPYQVKAKQRIRAGDQRIYFDTKRSDVRQGKGLYIFDGRTFQHCIATRIHDDGASISSPALVDYLPAARIMPATIVASGNNAVVNRATVDHYGTLNLTAMEQDLWAPFVHPGNVQELVWFQDLPVLDRRQMGEAFDDAHDTGIEFVDYETGPVHIRNTWKNGQNQFNRKFLLHRIWNEADFDYWKKLLNEVKGSQKPFLLPTHREDFDILTPCPPGGAKITVDGIKYAPAFFGRDGFRRIAIVTAAGTHYAAVGAATRLGTANILNFYPPLPSGPGWDTDQRVSFLMQVRIVNDRVTFDHHHLHTEISMTLRTVDDDGLS